MNDKKKNFGMWLFSESVSKALNWILVILAGIWIAYHLVRVIF